MKLIILCYDSSVQLRSIKLVLPNKPPDASHPPNATNYLYLSAFFFFGPSLLSSYCMNADTHDVDPGSALLVEQYWGALWLGYGSLALKLWGRTG